MSKPRNKTNRRRLHYVGVLAAAGLLTMGASPLLAQTDSIPDIVAGATSVTGIVNPGHTAVNNWTGNPGATITFEDINDVTGPVTLVTTITNIAGITANDIEVKGGVGGNAGVNIVLGTGNLDITGDITANTGSTLTFTVGLNQTLKQTPTETIDGVVTVVDNAIAPGAANVVLGVLQGDSVFTYTGNSDGYGATVAGTAIGAETTITNMTYFGYPSKLTVIDTGVDSKTTFAGGGITTLRSTGNNATEIINGGTIVAYDDTIGTHNTLNIEDGAASFTGTFTGPASNFDKLTMDSTVGVSALDNSVGSALNFSNTGLEATVDDDDVVIGAGAGINFGDNSSGNSIDLASAGNGSFKVEGYGVTLTGVNKNISLNTGGTFTFDFTGINVIGDSKQGISNVNQLVTSKANTIVDFARVTTGLNTIKSYQVVNDKVVNAGQTTYIKDFTIIDVTDPAFGAITDREGIYTNGLDLKATLIADSAFVVDATRAGTPGTSYINFTTDLSGSNGLANGATAIYADGGTFDIADGTVFSVDNSQGKDTGFQVIGGGNAASQWGNLAYVDGNGRTAAGDGNWYSKNSGYYKYYTDATIKAALTNNARFATPFVNSLFNHWGPAGIAMGNSTNQEITLAMGNTLNAALMMLNNPFDAIFRNNNNLHPQTESRLAKSAGDCENFGLWITPNASFRSIDGDYGRGYGDADFKSYGVTVGFDGWVHENFRLGLFAGVNSSEMDADFQDIDGDDFQLGVYGQAFLPEGFTLNLGVAYSWQNYDAERRVYNSQDRLLNQRIKSDFDGNTLIAAIELNKTFSLDYDMFLRPSIGYTYLGTELDSYREKSNIAAHLSPDYNLAQRVNKTDFDQHIIRAGTDIGWAVDNAAVIGRLYYVGNAGDDQPETRARFRYAGANVPGFKIYGAEYDDSMANLGLTVKVAPSENSHFAIDYDALLGSNSSTHNVNLTFKYEW